MTTVTATPESTTTETETWPQLLAGTELIGQAAGSGLREAPYLVRRCDGQVVQLSPILYELVGLMEGRDPEAIADAAAEDLDLRVTPDQITQIAETKLAPLGLVRYQDGSTAPLQRRNALLLLRYRVGIVPTRAVHVIGGLLAPLFWAPLVLLAIVALMGADVWMFSSSGVISGVRTVIQTPDLMLATFGVTILSLAFHECGHAAACRYGGASPGRIGVGIYLVWPVFYTDVTDSYRLSRAGRLRTDLGGVYFNGLISLAAVGGFLLSGYRPLLLVAAGQQALMIEQFVPWMRLDGYHVISDLIGVSDLFARIRPVISSMLPGREPSRGVTELKPWARRVVTVWVMMSVTALLGMLAYAGAFAPRIIPATWESLNLQIDLIKINMHHGQVLPAINGGIGAFMLVLPALGLTFTFLLLCRSLGAVVAVRHCRREARRESITLTNVAPPAPAGAPAAAAAVPPAAVRVAPSKPDRSLAAVGAAGE